MSSNSRRRLYTLLVYFFLILAISSGGLAVYFYQLESAGFDLKGPTGGPASIADIGKALANIDGMFGTLDAPISQLHSINSVNSTSSPGQLKWSGQMEARPAALTVAGRTSDVYLARQHLQSVLGQTGPDANMTAVFFYSDSLTYSIAYGVYANTGLKVAHSVKVTFTFYSGPISQGIVLCSTSYLLGDIPGQTILTLDRVACGNGTTLASSVVYQFQWL